MNFQSPLVIKVKEKFFKIILKPLKAKIKSKVINAVKTIEKLNSNNNEYDSDSILDCFKKIDNSFNEDKTLRFEISKALIKQSYPGIGYYFFSKTSV
jgi:hypothetical protein